MRLCLLSAKFPPVRCGVGDYSYHLSTVLAKMGHEVDVLTSCDASDPSVESVHANFRIHRAVSTWHVGQLPTIQRKLRHLQPEVVLLQYAPTAFDERGITLAANLLPAAARMIRGIRVIANLHELYVPLGLSPSYAAQGLWQRLSVLALAALSNALTVTSKEWERRLRRAGVRKRIDVIPVGSNIPVRPSLPEQKQDVRQRFLGNADGILVAGFGSMHDRDLPAVLYAFRRLKDRMAAKLVWIGGGTPVRQHRDRINAALRTNGLEATDVIWTGILPHQEVSVLLSASDIMLLPFGDGVSTRRTTAVAALQHGLPLLTTRGPNQEQWFVHGENVYQVPVGDREALAVGLLELAAKPELRARIAMAGRLLYEQVFSWEVLASQVMSSAMELNDT